MKAHRKSPEGAAFPAYQSKKLPTLPHPVAGFSLVSRPRQKEYLSANWMILAGPELVIWPNKGLFMVRIGAPRFV